jgi:hypothetical protein
MMSLPFRQQLYSGELGGGNRGTYVEDAFAFEPGGGRLSLAELERKQAEHDRVWRERGEAFERTLWGAWANVRPVAQPVLEGLERSTAAVVSPFVAFDEMMKDTNARRLNPGQREDWSGVGQVFRDVLENPSNVSFERLVPGWAGTVLDVLTPGPADAVQARRLAGPALDGLSALLSKWEGVAPGLGAFLLPLRESFARGSSSERLAQMIDDGIDQYLDPTDAARFREDLRNVAFRQAETKSPGLYPEDNFEFAAEDIVQNRLVPATFDSSMPGMRRLQADLEGFDPQNPLWRKHPELLEDFEEDIKMRRFTGLPNDFFGTLVRRLSDYDMPDIYSWGRSGSHIQGTDATRLFDSDVQVPDGRGRAGLARYTGEGNVQDFSLTQGTEDNIENMFQGNMYNAVNTFLRTLDSIRLSSPSASRLTYDEFYNIEMADSAYALGMARTVMGPRNPISWIEDPSDLSRIMQEVRYLDRAFSSASLPSDTVVYRGAFVDPNHPIGIDINALMEQARSDPNFDWRRAAEAFKGREVMDRGFSSFTERPEHAYSFLRPKRYSPTTGEEGVGVLYQMRLPQGSPAIPLYGYFNDDDYHKIGAFAAEQEILLPRGVALRIVDAKFKFPQDVGQGSTSYQGARHQLDSASELKPYLVILVEPDFSQVKRP